MTKNESTVLAKILVKKLGKGWKPRVWENMGWHYSAELVGGHVCVYPSGDGYYCSMSSGDHARTGSYDWHDLKSYKDPRFAVANILVLAHQYVIKMGDWVSYVENKIKLNRA